MTLGKLKLLAAALAAAAVIAAPAVARIVHNRAAAASQDYGVHHVVGADGKLIGSAPNATMRSQWQQDGLPD